MKGNNSSSIAFGAIEAITERPDAPIVAGVDAAAAIFDPDRDLVDACFAAATAMRSRLCCDGTTIAFTVSRGD